MRAFVTGGRGFVGGFLRAHLESCGDVVVDPFIELADTGALTDAVVSAAPDVVYHLAGQADVARSWRDPVETWEINALGTVRLLEAVRRCAVVPRVVVVSSAEVYGHVRPDALPVTEGHPVRPVTPYGASKAAAELAALQAAEGGGVPVVVARPFNHIGPGQSDAFLVSAVARQIAEAEVSGADHISVGSLEAARDFTDVRDVVRAYRCCATDGRSGSVYKVCSGVAVPVREVVDRLLSFAARPLVTAVDPDRLRPVDVPEVRGDASRLRADTGWAPTHELDEALAACLGWWRDRLVA